MTRRTAESSSNPYKKESKWRRNAAVALIGASAFTLIGCGDKEGEVIAAPTGGVEQPIDNGEAENPVVVDKIESEEQLSAYITGMAPRMEQQELQEAQAEVSEKLFADVKDFSSISIPVSSYESFVQANNDKSERLTTIQTEFGEQYVEVLSSVNEVSLFDSFDSSEAAFKKAEEMHQADAIATWIDMQTEPVTVDDVNAFLADKNPDSEYSQFVMLTFIDNIVGGTSTLGGPVSEKLGFATTQNTEADYSFKSLIASKLYREYKNGGPVEDTIAVNFDPTIGNTPVEGSNYQPGEAGYTVDLMGEGFTTEGYDNIDDAPHLRSETWNVDVNFTMSGTNEVKPTVIALDS